MKKLGVNRDNQKKTNRGLILRLIATEQCTSRVDLARMTGLTKAAISQIVNELIDLDYLVETQKEQSADLGRKAVGLDISPNAPHYAGIQIFREGCRAVLCDMKARILKSEVIWRRWQEKEDLVASVYALLDHMLENEENVAGIGIASIGPVKVKEGIIAHPLYFNNIGDIEIRRMVEERYGLPAFFDHDNQSAVQAEHLFGNGRGYQDVLLVSVSTGVGCGILVDGKRVHSYTGYAPEIGHISIDYDGPQCICGNAGCLESYLNSVSLMRRFRGATGLDLSYRDFCGRYEDPRIDEIMRDIIRKFSCGLLSVLNVLNSQIVLLSMDCNYWPDCYVEMLEQEINRKKFGNQEMLVPVRKAYFREMTQAVGAASNVISQVFKGELL